MVKYFCIHTLALVKKCFEYIYTLDFINLKKIWRPILFNGCHFEINVSLSLKMYFLVVCNHLKITQIVILK